jgi:hypothetical protein
VTRERARELLPVIEAWARGEMIQSLAKYPGATWQDCNSGASFSDDYEYRIKPRPLECWAIWCPADARLICGGRVYMTQAEAQKAEKASMGICRAEHRIIRMREVVE